MLDPNEILTDNSKIERCKWCINCKFNNGGDNWSNSYDKCCCGVFKYPEYKPNEVIHNAYCDFYVKK